jgi:hypothetical protein
MKPLKEGMTGVNDCDDNEHRETIRENKSVRTRDSTKPKNRLRNQSRRTPNSDYERAEKQTIKAASIQITLQATPKMRPMRVTR